MIPQPVCSTTAGSPEGVKRLIRNRLNGGGIPNSRASAPTPQGYPSTGGGPITADHIEHPRAEGGAGLQDRLPLLASAHPVQGKYFNIEHDTPVAARRSMVCADINEPAAMGYWVLRVAG